jgi:hypothetical protein
MQTVFDKTELCQLQVVTNLYCSHHQQKRIEDLRHIGAQLVDRYPELVI